MGCVIGAGQEAVRRAAAADQQVVDLEPPHRTADAQVGRAVAEVDMDARGPHCHKADLVRQVDRSRSPLLAAADGSLVLQNEGTSLSSFTAGTATEEDC